MIIKLLKIGAILSIIGLSSFFVVFKENKTNSSPTNYSLAHNNNSASKIKYNAKLKGGNLELSAEEISFLQKKKIKLKGINAIYSTKAGKKISISAGECIFSAAGKTVSLSKNIVVKDENTIIRTNRALVDIANQTIRSSSAINGKRNNIVFNGSGFTITKDGKISIKKAKMNMDKK